MSEARSPYQLAPADLADNLDQMVEVTFASLTSQFMLLPRGASFVTYDQFLAGYEALRMGTNGFMELDTEHCWAAIRENATAFVVLRTILGVSPPEWQDLAAEEPAVEIPPSWTRTIDGRVKRDPAFFTTNAGQTPLVVGRITALLAAACRAIQEGAAEAPEGLIHRLEKLDTRDGLESLQ